MSIIIGQEPGRDFRDPLGLLTDCHRRIENFLNVLHTVVRQNRAGHLDEEHRQGLDVSLRYFRESAPKHNADEEESLFPRMLSGSGSHRETVSQILQRLSTEHRVLSSNHDEVDDLGRSWLRDDFLAAQERTRMATILQDLQQTYTRHIATEEQDLFPLAAQILEPDDLQSISNEMVRRRGLSLNHYEILNRAMSNAATSITRVVPVETLHS